MISPEQIRGARAMLGLTQADLAKRAGISTTGLNNIERGGADSKASTLKAIRTALEAAGAEFIAENGGGAGVRLRKAKPESGGPEPKGPATDVIVAMDQAIEAHKATAKRRK